MKIKCRERHWRLRACDKLLALGKPRHRAAAAKAQSVGGTSGGSTTAAHPVLLPPGRRESGAKVHATGEDGYDGALMDYTDGPRLGLAAALSSIR